MSQLTQQNQNQLRIPLNQTKELVCECGCAVFEPGLSMRQISAIATGTGKDEVMPVEIIHCKKCFKRFEPPQTTVSSLITP